MNLPYYDLIRGAGAVVAGSLIWLQYWDLKDRRRPEPRLRLFAACALGGLAALLALGMYRLAGEFGVPVVPGLEPRQVLLVSFGVVAPIEEVAKFAVARAIVFRWTTFDQRVDGIVYAAAVALGFAAVENLLWLPRMEIVPGLVRALCLPLVHTLFAAIWGLGTSYALLERRGPVRFLWQVGALAAAVFVHGTYDAILYLGGSLFLIAGVVLVLWIGISVAARHAAMDDGVAEPAMAPAGSREMRPRGDPEVRP